jgi:hypothetical protein
LSANRSRSFSFNHAQKRRIELKSRRPNTSSHGWRLDPQTPDRGPGLLATILLMLYELKQVMLKPTADADDSKLALLIGRQCSHQTLWPEILGKTQPMLPFALPSLARKKQELSSRSPRCANRPSDGNTAFNSRAFDRALLEVHLQKPWSDYGPIALSCCL